MRLLFRYLLRAGFARNSVCIASNPCPALFYGEVVWWFTYISSARCVCKQVLRAVTGFALTAPTEMSMQQRVLQANSPAPSWERELFGDLRGLASGFLFYIHLSARCVCKQVLCGRLRASP